MRLGGNVFYHGNDPQEYALAHVEKGFGAALCPDWISLERPAELRAFKDAMKNTMYVLQRWEPGAIPCIRIRKKRKRKLNI